MFEDRLKEINDNINKIESNLSKNSKKNIYNKFAKIFALNQLQSNKYHKKTLQLIEKESGYSNFSLDNPTEINKLILELINLYIEKEGIIHDIKVNNSKDYLAALALNLMEPERDKVNACKVLLEYDIKLKTIQQKEKEILSVFIEFNEDKVSKDELDGDLDYLINQFDDMVVDLDLEGDTIEKE